MKSSGLFRIARDAETRFLPDGTAVANVSLAFNYGKKGQDGKQPTQWIDGSIFGKRAEVLGPMLLKGTQHVFHLSDLHIETFQGKNGEGHKLVGRVDDVELTDRRDGAPAQQAQRPAPQPAQRQAPARAAPSGFDPSFDDGSDIPF
jgi:single-strand DNA-binding protein